MEGDDFMAECTHENKTYRETDRDEKKVWDCDDCGQNGVTYVGLQTPKQEVKKPEVKKAKKQ
jgi:ribosomal protein L37AE/L43A